MRHDLGGRCIEWEQRKKPGRDPRSAERKAAMDVDLVFKIAAVGILVSVLNQVLTRSGREEQATMTSLAGLVVVLMMLAQKIADLFDLVKTLFEF